MKKKSLVFEEKEAKVEVLEKLGDFRHLGKAGKEKEIETNFRKTDWKKISHASDWYFPLSQGRVAATNIRSISSALPYKEI